MARSARWCAAVLVAVASLTTTHARAQTPSGPVVEVGVTGFTPWNDPEHSLLTVQLRIANPGAVPIERPRVRMTLYERVTSRSALRTALDGRPQDVVYVTTEPFGDPLEPGAIADVKLERDLALVESSFRRRTAGGVYPVEIEVRGADRSLWTGWAAVVYFPQPPATRLNLAWVLPVHVPSMYDPDGTSYPGNAVDRRLGPGGTVLPAVRAVAAAAQAMPVTLAISGLALDMLRDIADGFERRDGRRTVQATSTDAAPRAAAEALDLLRKASESTQVQLATTPYGRADLVSLVHAELQSDALRQLSTAAARTNVALGHTPRSDVVVPGGLRIDSRSAATAAAYGARTMVVDPSFVPKRSGIFGPDRPVRVTGRGGVQLDALLADEPIRSRIERLTESDGTDTDPVLAAQAVVAETASGWYERPQFAGARALVVATTTTPPARTIAALGEAFASAPWLQMRTVSDMPVAVQPEDDPVPLPLGRSSPSDWTKALKEARKAVDVLGRIVAGPPDATADLDRRLLAAESIDWEDGNRGTALALAVKSETDATVRRIRAPSRQVTLTSRTGQIPVTVINDTRFAVRVRVRVQSAKVEFPEGAEQTVEIPERRSTTITFPAKALATGAFGVDVELRTPDGAYPIGSESIVVRSTAVSAVALISILGGLLVLLVAWFRRGRRNARFPAAGVPQTG